MAIIAEKLHESPAEKWTFHQHSHIHPVLRRTAAVSPPNGPKIMTVIGRTSGGTSNFSNVGHQNQG